MQIPGDRIKGKKDLFVIGNTVNIILQEWNLSEVGQGWLRRRHSNRGRIWHWDERPHEFLMRISRRCYKMAPDWSI